MTWYYIDTGFNTGKFNMDFDLHLTEISRPGEAYFRLYRWKPYCISLGAGQDMNSINLKRAEEDNIDIVKRPTGGRAVLHAEELTYSVIIPIEPLTSARQTYFEINAALSEGLKKYHPSLSLLEMEQQQTDFSNFYKTPAGSICFAAPSRHELKYSGRKIVGSAQRKMDNVLLQHGSVLCGSYHKNITGYLYLSDQELLKINGELEEKTAEIESVLDTPVNYDRLKESLAEGFEYYFNIKLNRLDLNKRSNFTSRKQ
jgi:lipoyl(octanoyl) transferase